MTTKVRVGGVWVEVGGATIIDTATCDVAIPTYSYSVELTSDNPNPTVSDTASWTMPLPTDTAPTVQLL